MSNSDENSEGEDNNFVEAKDKVYSHIQLYSKLFMKEQHPEQEQISCLLWESNIELEELNLMNTKRSKLKSKFKNNFDTPINSLTVFLPYSFWKKSSQRNQ